MGGNNLQGHDLKDLFNRLSNLDTSKAREPLLCSSNNHLKRGWLFFLSMLTISVTGDDLEEIQKLKEKLVNEFEIKDLRNLRYFLSLYIYT